VVLRVDWTQGRTNGLAHWQIGAMDVTTPGDTTDAAPQFDTNVFPAPGHLADGFTGTLDLPIVTDRGAHYRATLSGDCFLPGATSHVVTGVRADHLISGPPDAFWQGLCPGSTYFITLEVWDTAGHRATYGFPGDSATHRWPGGEAFIPALRLDLTALMSNGPQARDHNSYGIRYISVDITPGGGLDNIVPAQPCVAANRPLEILHGTGEVQQAHTYTVTVTVYAFNQDTREESTGGPASQCGYVRANYATSVFTGTFTYEQLVRDGGVRVQGDGVFAPGSSAENFAGFHTDLQLTATPHVGR
jgi:hypothetical protein